MSIYRLKGTAGAVINQAYRLADKLVIGRADDCDIRVDEENIAPHEVEIALATGGGVSLKALVPGSTVQLNGEGVAEAELAGGDEIRVGSCRLMLQAPGLRPDRVLTQEAIKPRRKLWPWILIAGVGAVAALAWKQGHLSVWVAYLSGLIAG